MPAIPANLPTRREIQSFILRCIDAGDRLDPEMSGLLGDLATAAANLEGRLAEMAGESSLLSARKALEPNGWTAEWVEQRNYLHTARGVFNTVVAQQVLLTPEGRPVPTGRYRLTLGDETHCSANRVLLRNLLGDYLAGFSDLMPDAVGKVLDRHFATEGDDAVQVEEAGEVDVRQRPGDGQAVG